MKYATIGPKKGIIKIHNEKPVGSYVELTDIIAEKAQTYLNNRQFPFIIDNDVTTIKTEVDNGYKLVWNDSDKKWERKILIVPKKIKMWQARAALKMTPIENTNLLDKINVIIQNLPENSEKVLITTAWEYAIDIERDSQIIEKMRVLIGITEEQMDELFVLANSLKL